MPIVSEADQSAYRNLWRAVICRSIEDLYDRNPEVTKLLPQTLAWFDPLTSDFQMVCEFGEIDPAVVMKIFAVWTNHNDRRLVRLMMLKEGILPPTEKENLCDDFI